MLTRILPHISLEYIISLESTWLQQVDLTHTALLNEQATLAATLAGH